MHIPGRKRKKYSSSKLFPPPKFLEMPAAGIDISDHSIKYLEFVRTSKGFKLGKYGSIVIPDGIVVSGVITKPKELVGVLRKLKQEKGIHFVRASLPEEQAYLFEVETPATDEKEIRSSLEFRLEENVPLKPEEAVFDFDVIKRPKGQKTGSTKTVVTVFPRRGIENYVKLFEESDLTLLSLEMEAQAIARSVISRNDLKTYMIVDFGKDRSGISIVSESAVRFATTIGVGGDMLSAMIHRHYPDATAKEVDDIKNDQGIAGTRDRRDLYNALVNTVNALAEELNKHFIYWHSKVGGSEKRLPIEKVILCGGNANLAGLPGHLSTKLNVPVERANVWTNVFDLEEHIPAINFTKSLGYAPAVGLALHSFSSLSDGEAAK